MDLLELQNAIASSGAGWEAKETSAVGRLTPNGTGLFGLALTETDRERLLAEADRLEDESGRLASDRDVPKRVDWREEHIVSDVRDQGTCGSCVAFATCAAIEARYRMLYGDAGAPLDLSEAHLFHCGAPGQCDEGWRPDDALLWLQSHGIGREADFPYVAADQPCREIPSVARVPHWSAATSTDQRRRVVAFNGPAIGAMRVFEDFLFYAGGVYTHVAGEQLGLHAVCVVGFDDTDGAWIVKNSWSTAWGEEGFFRIAYGQCGIDTEFPFFDPDVERLT